MTSKPVGSASNCVCLAIDLEEAVIPQAGALSDEALRAYDFDEELATWVIERAGLKFLLDEKQTWSVGGQEIPVSVWLDRKNRYVLLLHEGPFKSLCLGEIHAATVTKRIQRLNGPALAQWKRGALVEAGRARPMPVALAELPLDAPRSAQKTWNVVRQTLEVRIAGETEITLSAPMMEEWWGVSQATVRNGKIWLKQNGYLRKVGARPSGYGKPTDLFRVRMAGEPPLNSVAEEAIQF